jgi:hypothetical protein
VVKNQSQGLSLAISPQNGTYAHGTVVLFKIALTNNQIGVANNVVKLKMQGPGLSWSMSWYTNANGVCQFY